MAPPEIVLSQEDRDDLVDLIASLDIFQDLAGRRTLIKLARPSVSIPDVQLMGDPRFVARTLIEALTGLPRDTSGDTSLGRFLVTFKPHLNFNLERNQFIDSIIDRYGLFALSRGLFAAEPIEIPVPTPARDLPAFSQEALKKDTLRDITFLEQGINASRAVVLIEMVNRTLPAYPARWTGTGFLIAPRLLITNHHVLPDRALLASTTFLLNHQRRLDGGLRAPVMVHAQRDGFFFTNEQLDYTLVELKEDKSGEVGYLPLPSRVPVAVNERLNIIGHPNGEPKTISIQDNFALGFQEHYVLYSTSTTWGSSGSPVLNDNWVVVALHSQGGFRTTRDQVTGILEKVPSNRGVAAEAIRADMFANQGIHGDQRLRRRFLQLIPWREPLLVEATP